ncbi:major facilitator superfamily domain-containing protein [Chytriomyces sp. MP71]|nr:major facilitator superfamily domain-containing protein [Chytriomyces sp. MP71]
MSNYADRGAESAKRAQAFAHLDEAKLGWFHLRAVIVSGVGFFADAYDIFVISQAINMIYQVYYSDYVTGKFPPGTINWDGKPLTDLSKTPQNQKVDFNNNYPNGKHMDAWLKASTNWGNLVGQVGFGILGDKLGRKKMYGVELIIMIVCTIGSAFCAPMKNGWSILVILSLWRFFLGIGIGGDYPMSAVITSEFANVRYRGMMLSAVFAMQGIGIMVGGIVFIATLAGMKSAIQADYTVLDQVWRIALGFGVVPAIGAVYFRLTIPETPRFTVDVIGDTQKADSDVLKVLQMNSVANVGSNWEGQDVATAKVVVKTNTFSDFTAYFGQWRNMKTIIGTAYCWFALDVAWYGLSLNQSTVLNLINFNGPAKVTVNGSKPFAPPVDIADLYYQIALGNLIIAFCGTVPGYWFCVALVEKLGRKPIQYFGFFVITVCLALLGAMWDTLKNQQVPFLVIFTIAQFFFQFGPNTTTFIVPGEVFPTRFRSTGHGISAAAGKVGAVLGIQAVGPYFSNNTQIVLIVFAVIMATGMAATWLIPETAGKTLEELSGEDDVIIA